MYGTCGSRRRPANAASIVTRPTDAVAKSISRHCASTRTIVSTMSLLATTVSPRKLASWPTMIRMPAPAVKPMITVNEMKFTIAPRRARPSASCTSPTISVSVSTSAMYGALPGTASGVTIANTASEIVLVGPDTWCQDDPQSAATIAGTMALNRPYCGGSPASVAYAIACGSTTQPPTRPARRSARNVARVTRGSHAKNGRRRAAVTAPMGEMRDKADGDARSPAMMPSRALDAQPSSPRRRGERPTQGQSLRRRRAMPRPARWTRRSVAATCSTHARRQATR